MDVSPSRKSIGINKKLDSIPGPFASHSETYSSAMIPCVCAAYKRIRSQAWNDYSFCELHFRRKWYHWYQWGKNHNGHNEIAGRGTAQSGIPTATSLNHRDSTFFKHVFVLRVSDGQRSPGSRANHELKAQLTRYGGDEGDCAIGIFATGDFAFPLAKTKDRGSA